MTAATSDPGSDLMRRFVPASPFVAHAGIELVDLRDGNAELRLPYRDEVTTMATVVHGGAIATLVDTAAMVAAWAGADVPDELRGATVALTVTYLAPADGQDVVAVATVLRRGRRLTTVRVDVSTPDGTAVASGLVTYQLG